ncbi:glycoside hydrolase family 57 protein [uncultured Gilvimarinus sp.]|uniref:glycoside hydrolase family 57 protein n=1 Tax=uncultured Gilvimarinus sp. TaxID=1689143 RepID=UPI0030D84D08
MSGVPETSVVFLWHMHQPDYRDCLTGEYYFPWTYLHAIKDYTDMAAHLENNPGSKAVFNYVPILIEQLVDYDQQLNAYLTKGELLSDPLLALLTNAERPEPGSERFADLLQKCTRANRERIIDRFEPYQHLMGLYDNAQEVEGADRYFNQQYLTDLCVWYHLGWLGETVRRDNPIIERLQQQSFNYTADHCRDLLQVIYSAISGIIPRHKKLAESGQAELITSPYAHPILPLLLDFNSTHDAMPAAPLPNSGEYPGGEARAHWQMQKGLDVFKQHFGNMPKGCWASEGALSDAALKVLSEHGIRWTATGDSVLFNSLQNSANNTAADKIKSEPDTRHTAFQVGEGDVHVFFRDDGLSDKIGFEYANWHADDAVGDFVHHLENIAKAAPADNHTVISIIMDGENAWEYYPENAWYFIDALYKKIEAHPYLTTRTYSEVLELADNQAPLNTIPLEHLCAGSWVYGTFSTWIGEAEKNHAWDILCEVKRAYDQVIDSGALDQQQSAEASLQLALCEGSDWFWWFGDYNPSDSVKDFDRLYRQHVSNLYTSLGLVPPSSLDTPISTGSGAPANGGVMRQGHQ